MAFPVRARVKTGDFSDIPYGRLLGVRYSNCYPAANDTYVLDLPNKKLSHVSFCTITPELSHFELLSLGRHLNTAHDGFNTERIGIVIGSGFAEAQAERIAEALISAVLAAHANLPRFSKNRPGGTVLKHIVLYGIRTGHRFRTSFAIAQGNELARGLSMLPGNLLAPADYLQRIRELAQRQDWALTFYNQSALQRKKAGAFLAVAKGSDRQDAGIVRLRYHPRKADTTERIVLVGKGVCYDTGGVNLKPARHMFGMHEDMQGSAVALGTLYALSRLNFSCPVECWLALASNHIGPQAYKPNDVVTAADGTTIEIVHTDAEGRMILADTLALASRTKPQLIIDYATLTGSCVAALGKAYSGIFSNRRSWLQALIANGVECGERVWPFPLDPDFDKLLHSDIADIRQCALAGGTDHILAARFLQRFIKPGVPWIHMDLSSSNNPDGLAHVPTATTGFGVRYTVHLLEHMLPYS